MFKEDLTLDEAADLDGLLQALRNGVGIQQVRSIVMTQACDLEQRKIRNVILCPAFTIEEFRTSWSEAFAEEKGKQPRDTDWNSHIGNVKAGRLWNLTLARKRERGDGIELATATTVVDFHEVFSLPLAFLELWVRKAGQRRLRLRPPYREHVSQAFARFFMRVGLPVDIEEV